ncbi:MAG TPA: cobalt ECF transporter T component CbiQ [Thermoplasmatales archaeon]|nr:cobalt ECF transporter T component CbiQ [Thermoplasmatales archaeon]
MSKLIDKTLNSTIGYISQAIYSEKYSKEKGLLQGIDCRVKLAAFLVLIISAVYASTIDMLLIFLLISSLLAISSRIPLSFYIPRVWLFVPLFTGIIAIPAVLNVVTPGTDVLSIANFNGWHISVTREGIHAASILVIRVAATSSFAILFTLTTRWNDAMEAMHSLKLPRVFILILSMSYRYIFSLLDVTKKMLLSRKSRIIGKERAVSSWRLYSPIIAALFMKSFSFNERVYLSMLARGFGGEYTSRKKARAGATSMIFLSVCIIVPVLLLIYERTYPDVVFQWFIP